MVQILQASAGRANRQAACQVIQSMLKMASSLRRARHTAMLDLVVIILVLICGLLALLQFAAILGWIGEFHLPKNSLSFIWDSPL